MLIPDPDNQRITLSIPDFLNSITDRKRKSIYHQLLTALMVFRGYVEKRWPSPDGVPDIKIIKNGLVEDTEIRDILNTACISQGLLDRCLEYSQHADKFLGSSYIPKPLGQLSVAKIAIMWATGHELFHFIRRHELVSAHFGNDQATAHALEFDADLCSAAAVFRHLQYFIKKPPLSLKVMLLKLLYWPLRIEISDNPPTPFEGTLSHPNHAARLMDIIAKLAMTHDRGIVDQNFSLPITRAHNSKLKNTWIEIEQKYFHATQPGRNLEENPVFSFAVANHSLEYTLKRHERWAEIEKLIYHFTMLPRNFVPNDSFIAFMGEVNSLPRIENS